MLTVFLRYSSKRRHSDRFEVANSSGGDTIVLLAPECHFKWDGAALGIFLVAVPLAVLLSVATLFLYRWAVGRAMRAAAAEEAAVPESEPPSSPRRPLQIIAVSPSEALTPPPNMAATLQAMRRLSMVYALAGLAHAILATTVLFWLNGLEFKPFRTLAVWTIYAWPVVLVLAMTAAATRRQQALLSGAYFGFLLILDIAAEVLQLREQPAFGQFFELWAITMGLPTAVIVLLANRAWRSVGLTALLVSIMVVGAYVIGFQLLGCVILTTQSAALLRSMSPLLFGIVAASALLAWALLRRAGRRYQAMRASDQMLMVDSCWLLVTAVEILSELGSSGVMGFSLLMAFAGYKIALHLGFGRLRLADLPARPQSMLLLRVFGHADHARTLLEQVGQVWRHAGPINMIGGTDLATVLLEPDELMMFVGGKLRQRFVASQADLEGRLQGLDEARDSDGRFRVNEFFCHDNTWRATVRALAQRSTVVLMDLCGFGKDNRGCEFELSMLVGEVPLGRVLLLVDRSTRVEDLKALLHRIWEELPASSPNRDSAEPALHLIQIEDRGDALGRLLPRLFRAAD